MDIAKMRVELENARLQLVHQMGIVVGKLAMLDELEHPSAGLIDTPVVNPPVEAPSEPTS